MNLQGELVLIVGGGKAGLRAFEFAKKNKAKIIVIDTDTNCPVMNFIDYFLEPKDITEIDSLLSPNRSILIHGGMGLVLSLIEKYDFRYIFPCIPQHVTAKIVLYYLTKIGRKKRPNQETFPEIIKEFPSDLIYNFDKKKAIAVLSYMENSLDCIDNCTAPDVCPVTGKKKEVPLFKLIKSKIEKYNGIVIESKQIAPGLGAIEGQELKKILKFVKKKKNFIVATASRCHGIINAFLAN